MPDRVRRSTHVIIEKLQEILKITIAVGGSPWRIALATYLIQYFIRNIFLLANLNAPNPLARSYNRNFYRATWILTALDAGFFTAMPLRPKWLREILSIIISLYYLVFADAADEKVRRIRATISIEQLRYSWEKADHNPILRTISRLMIQPRMVLRDRMNVKRSNGKPLTEIYRYYAGPMDTYADQDTILLSIPGGGFVSMPPPCHEDALTSWAKHTSLPVISINYRKAPEYPFPWPIEECFELYTNILQTKGKTIGLSGKNEIKIILAGDSAGGNIVCGVTMKAITHQIPKPIGIILVYPALDFELSCWMPPAQLSLIRAESQTSLFRSTSFSSILQSKDHLSRASPLSVVPDTEKSGWKQMFGKSKEEPIKDKIKTYEAWASSRVAMTSRMSFFNDRIIPPDLVRAMAILYLGPHAPLDFGTDCLLSPIHTPENILAQFPTTYMMCGEKDPFVDDTVILAGRIRQARLKYRQEHPLDEHFPQGDGVRVKFLEGVSHAFLQMLCFLPEAKQAIKTLGDWMIEIQNNAQKKPANALGDDHVAEIITTEKDLFHRRKQLLVNGLY
ncbi:hypothetical protein G6F46_000537 [Rhizopus delemar]|uniref:Alpha/beta hydrolase fold-3 domain-containing protein n=2 Tax=Rhizopus TaxID=4842 RepID=A0A9P6Z3P1_9FUNG|nr:hypothetical protein G6F43_000787 [Rhizopus delemar]KAG1553300.1 hypothetical protein G6F51_000692 [Rhizopus arrhizus]KAG1458492.1 hypothetical protein G6F55_005315 [Rhizopus delemar]KAG1504514.1 hypothetical protein G6F54_000953 [Rhizopus delemar]KAG1529066.1 hypothetical protein G6F52_000079 [Rhizopus delemar]